MSEHTNSTSTALPNETTAIPQADLNMAYILSRIDMVLQDTQYLQDAIRSIREMPPVEGPCLQFDSRATAIGEAVSAREQTNQKILALLERMYNDLHPQYPARELSTVLPILENPMIPNGIKAELFRMQFGSGAAEKSLDGSSL